MGGISLHGGAAAGGWLAHRKMGALDVRRNRTILGSPQFSAHERVLIRESAADGALHVGTQQALYLGTAVVAEPSWRRIGWTEVASVGWSRNTRTVTLRTWPRQADPAVTVRVRERSRLPQFAAERVTSCRVASRQVRISDQCTATISALRDPAAGQVTWTVFLDGGRDADDPALKPAIDYALAELRIQFGC